MQGQLHNNYIGGRKVAPTGEENLPIINPATGASIGSLRAGSPADVDRAVLQARQAFAWYSRSSRADRLALLTRLAAALKARRGDMARAVRMEIGCPVWLAERAQAVLAEQHVHIALESLKTYPFERPLGSTLICRAPVGVCGLITPWNWPASAMMGKVAVALATGCTMVLKPSEYTPFTAGILADALHEAGVPPGVFNMVQGTGPVVGAALAAHPEVDCVSVTGSVATGVAVAGLAAPGVKRVLQELGGKSPNIILPSADIPTAVARGLASMMTNSGQNCFGPSRLLTPESALAETKRVILREIERLQPGPPESGAFMGPVANKNQFERVRGYIRSGLEQGATLLTGGLEPPRGLDRGWYIRPTVFINTLPAMRIVREEIFGPVLVVQTYAGIDEALELALDTDYGLAAYVQGAPEEARAVAVRMRAGQVYINNSGDPVDFRAPFGGFKRSGNGREWGAVGFDDFLEHMSLVGYLT